MSEIKDVMECLYSPEGIYDAERDVSEFIEEMTMRHPKDADGYLLGSFRLVFSYEYEEKGDE